jgi:aerobic-type carbon monoxide dehydrogenase small subunit (CoxS/CutS family)
MKKELQLTVNGKSRKVSVEPKTLLVELLRNELGLTGAKMSCSCGSCCACTIILDGKAVRSCSVLALQANGRNVLTIEGLADGDKLHPIQESFVKNHGFQCGYCTPGFIMAAKALLDESPNPTEPEVRDAVEGHICRCGTYPRIVQSVLDAAKMMREGKK